MYGAFGIVPNEVDGAIITGNFWAYDYNKNIISIEWLNHFTNSPDFYELCRRASKGITHRKYLDEDFFLNYEINLPDIEEQKKIVASIDNIKDIICSLENNISHQLTHIENLTQAILQEAVQGKLVPQDPNDEPATKLLKRIKEEKKKVDNGKKQKPLPPIKPEEIPFEIPDSWVWCRLGEIAQHNSGKTLDCTRNKGMLRPYITTSNLYWGYFILDNLRQMKIEDPELDRCAAIKGDLLVCEGGEAGRSAIWQSEEPICFQNHIHRVRPYLGISSEYLYHYMKKIFFSGEIHNYRKGMGIKNLSGSSLSSIVLPLPPLSEQKRIVAEIEKQLAKTQQLKEYITANQEATEQLLKALLHEAFEVEK